MNKKQILFGALILAGLILFLKKDFFFRELPEKLLGPRDFSSHVLEIVLATPATDLSPYSLNLNNRIRTTNMYEGLVAFDRTLKIVPALAASWGNVDPVTWEFKLRREVIFHDGDTFDAQDVVDSLERARTQGGPEAATLLRSIAEVQAASPHLIRIKTDAPDPLLLSKLTSLPITRPDSAGTGPYRLHEWVKGESLSLTAFRDYWGPLPKFKNVRYRVMPNKWERSEAFNEDAIDILVAVPRDQALALGDRIQNSYSLEVNFLMFNLQHELLKDKALRQKIATLFDPAEIESIGNGFVRRVSQFVAPGVFGFDGSIPEPTFREEAKTTDLFSGKRKRIALDYPETYETLTQYLYGQLRDAGFSVALNPLPPATLLERIKTNQSDLFVLGWQAENGDAGDFLDAFIHSKGQFNNGRYANAVVDKLIEQSRTEIDPQARLKLLQEIMRNVREDVIGIPLFESTRLYAIRKGIEWKPRLDGLVLAAEAE